MINSFGMGGMGNAFKMLGIDKPEPRPIDIRDALSDLLLVYLENEGASLLLCSHHLLPVVFRQLGVGYAFGT